MENILVIKLHEDVANDPIIVVVPEYLGLVVRTDVDVTPPALDLLLVLPDCQLNDRALT